MNPKAQTGDQDWNELEEAKAWLQANREYLLRQYLGQWVAVSSAGVVASGRTMEETATEAESLCMPSPLLAPIRNRGPFGVLVIPSFKIVRQQQSSLTQGEGSQDV